MYIIISPSLPDSDSLFDISLREVAAEGSVSIYFVVLLSSAADILGIKTIKVFKHIVIIVLTCLKYNPIFYNLFYFIYERQITFDLERIMKSIESIMKAYLTNNSSNFYKIFLLPDSSNLVTRLLAASLLLKTSKKTLKYWGLF